MSQVYWKDIPVVSTVESSSDVADVSVESEFDSSVEPDVNPTSVVSAVSDAGPLSVFADVSEVSDVDPSKDEDDASATEVVESAFVFSGVVDLYTKNIH